MAIEWIPWFNVPMHRRLEVLSVAFLLFWVLGTCLIAIIFILYAVVILL